MVVILPNTKLIRFPGKFVLCSTYQHHNDTANEPDPAVSSLSRFREGGIS
jgi:hypothetical protein